ncbi:MAG: hypothetical protein LBG78_00610 [Azoarcus sp.]|jgi:hypothetical protein|nr:hypothetical protein [Azoarcus sp.]
MTMNRNFSMRFLFCFFRSKWGKRLAIALLILVSILTPSAYYAQMQGVCLKTGRVLSEEELKKAILVNMINFYIKDYYNYNWRHGNDSFWVGINSPAKETDMRKLIDDAYQSENSFENNFGLKVLLKGRNAGKYEKITADQLQEPFIFMLYEKGRHGSATAFVSTHFKKISYQELEKNLQFAAQKRINFYTTLLGYGNHYYDFGGSFVYDFHRVCCDNKTDEGYSDYLKVKKEAYEMALQSMTNSPGHEIRHIGMVSNCGDILLSQFGNISILGNIPEEENWKEPYP